MTTECQIFMGKCVFLANFRKLSLSFSSHQYREFSKLTVLIKVLKKVCMYILVVSAYIHFKNIAVNFLVSSKKAHKRQDTLTSIQKKKKTNL